MNKFFMYTIVLSFTFVCNGMGNNVKFSNDTFECAEQVLERDNVKPSFIREVINAVKRAIPHEGLVKAKNAKELPRMKNDHGMDAMRYHFHTLFGKVMSGIIVDGRKPGRLAVAGGLRNYGQVKPWPRRL